VTNYYQQPLVADHGSMQYLWDIEGNKYLDFFGGIVTIGVGHCNPKVTEKIKAQVDKLQHTSTLFPNEAIVALAEKLAQITPGSCRRAFSPARGRKRTKPRSCWRAWPGRVMTSWRCGTRIPAASALAKAVTAQAAWRKERSDQRGRLARGESLLLPLPAAPDVSRMRRGLRERRGKRDSDHHQRQSIAAFIAEPIQGVGGFITPPPEYFKIVYRIVKNYGGLFISDEVQTGFGPHRQEMVRHRTVGSDAGHHHLRQKHGQRHARGRDDHHRRSWPISSRA
jgi:hypothetical protein